MFRLHFKINLEVDWLKSRRNNNKKDVSVSQSQVRRFEAHHDPCSLLEGEATLPSQQNCI